MLLTEVEVQTVVGTLCPWVCRTHSAYVIKWTYCSFYTFKKERDAERYGMMQSKKGILVICLCVSLWLFCWIQSILISLVEGQYRRPVPVVYSRGQFDKRSWEEECCHMFPNKCWNKLWANNTLCITHIAAYLSVINFVFNLIKSASVQPYQFNFPLKKWKIGKLKSVF